MFGDVSSTQVLRSDDDGKTWAKAGRPHYSRIQGFDDQISWEMGPDGYLYAVSTQFSRSKPVYLWRANPEDIADQSKWEIYNTNTRSWGGKGTAILDRSADGSAVKAGEMNLRYCDHPRRARRRRGARDPRVARPAPAAAAAGAGSAAFLGL